MSADLYCNLEIRSVDGARKVGRIMHSDGEIKFEETRRWRVVAVAAPRFEYEEILFAKPLEGLDDASLSSIRAEWNEKLVGELVVSELPEDAKIAFLMEYTKTTNTIPDLGTFLAYKPTGRGAVFQRIGPGSYLVVAMNAKQELQVREVRVGGVLAKWDDLISPNVDAKRVKAFIELRKRCEHCEGAPLVKPSGSEVVPLAESSEGGTKP